MDVSTNLKALPQPELPRDFALDVLARVEAIEQPEARPVSVVSSRSMWLGALATVVAAALVVAALGVADVRQFRVAPLSGGGVRMSLMGSGTLQLLTGLALYVVGLLVPLPSRRRPRAR